jgi:hypothetical protein
VEFNSMRSSIDPRQPRCVNPPVPEQNKPENTSNTRTVDRLGYVRPPNVPYLPPRFDKGIVAEPRIDN